MNIFLHDPAIRVYFENVGCRCWKGEDVKRAMELAYEECADLDIGLPNWETLSELFVQLSAFNFSFDVRFFARGRHRNARISFSRYRKVPVVW